jgi:hypothetical protein
LADNQLGVNIGCLIGTVKVEALDDAPNMQRSSSTPSIAELEKYFNAEFPTSFVDPTTVSLRAADDQTDGDVVIFGALGADAGRRCFLCWKTCNCVVRMRSST